MSSSFRRSSFLISRSHIFLHVHRARNITFCVSEIILCLSFHFNVIGVRNQYAHTISKHCVYLKHILKSVFLQGLKFPETLLGCFFPSRSIALFIYMLFTMIYSEHRVPSCVLFTCRQMCSGTRKEAGFSVTK